MGPAISSTWRFLEALERGTPARVTVEDGARGRHHLAAQQSIATGRTVDLSEVEGFSA